MKNLAPDELSMLRPLLPSDVLITNPVDLIAYELDGSLGHGAAQGVILPRRTEELVIAMRWAAEHNVPVIARGAGTGLSGGALASKGGLIVSLARMKQVLELDETGRSAVVQPGIVHLTFDEYVRTKGLYYPPDPASGRACTLGGNLAENAGGPHCFKYGVTTNYITGLKTVLADGRVIHTGGRAFDYPEYDLTGILVGSEGTLGVMTEAEVRLVRNIPGIKTLMAIFDSVEEAGEAVSAVIAGGLVPATLEMMDRTMIGIVENYVHAGLPDAEALLIIEADGYPQSLDPQMAEIMAVLRDHKARELRLAKTAAERDQVDGTVPRSKLAATLAEINGICARHSLRVGYVFHAGDGNLHPLILFDPSDADMVRRVHLAGRAVMELCVRQGGTITGEHGVGSEKLQYMALMYNAGELAAMREIKHVFDPRNLLNPGKIVPELDESANQRISESANQRISESANRESANRESANDAVRSTQYAVRDTQDAVDTIRDWTATHQRIRIRGGGTKSSLLGPADVTLSTERLRGIQDYSLNDLYVTVRAGTPLAELQAELAKDRVWVPLASPWTQSTVGGIVATNFNAPLRMRYGSLRDLILAVTAVLPDGRVIRAGKPVVKNVAGYDLVKLFIGSHGTLGLITDVTFKLLPFPRVRSSMIVPLDDLATGLKLGSKLLKVCLVASALLLCRGCAQNGAAAPYALVYTAEGVPEDVAAELGQVRELLTAEGIAAPPVATPSGSDVWASWVNAAARTGATLRAGVPPKDAPGALLDLAPTLDDAPFIADLAFGLIYARSEHLSAVRGIARSVGGYAVALSAQDGPEGAQSDPWGHAPDGLDLMRALKARWNPRDFCNPGAFIV
ncbi:MAG: FAD-binding protein [Chloroflexi bacterium]|nr:FAD-binding protein [Chloroflexota bacterium]